MLELPCGSGPGLAGMRQRDLIEWYVDQQNERNSYSSMEEANKEIKLVRAIIQVNMYLCCTIILSTCFVLKVHMPFFVQHLIVQEGHLIVVDDGRPVDGEVEGEPPSIRIRNNRILAVAPNYVVD